MRAVFRRAFLQPHVLLRVRRHHVAPPVVAQLVGEEPPIVEEALRGHEIRIGDVGGDLQRAVRGEHVAHPLPRIRAVPVFTGVDGRADVRELRLHRRHLRRLRGEPHRHVAVGAHMHEVRVHIIRHGDGREVRWDPLVEVKSAHHRVAAQLHLAEEFTLAVRAEGARALHMVGVRGAFHEGIEAGIPHLAEVRWNGGEADAEVVDVVGLEVEAAPVGVAVRMALVVHRERIHAAGVRRHKEVHAQRLSVVAEGERPGGRGDGIHLQVPKLEADEVLPRHQRREGDGGGGFQLLCAVVRHVDGDVVVQDVEGVAARDDVVDQGAVRGGGHGGRMGMLTEIVATVFVGLGHGACAKHEHTEEDQGTGGNGHGAGDEVRSEITGSVVSCPLSVVGWGRDGRDHAYGRPTRTGCDHAFSSPPHAAGQLTTDNRQPTLCYLQRSANASLLTRRS